MARSTTLGKHLTPINQQRLSIADIERIWNAEIHRAEGRSPYQHRPDFAELDKKKKENYPEYIATALSTTLAGIANIHKWQDGSGNLYENDPIGSDLIELARKGDLRIFRSQDPAASPVPPDDLGNSEVTQDKHFIDRDDLGCFLVARGQTLPHFWYEATDENVYVDRLAKQVESVAELRDHLKALVAENELLRRQLLEARPFMNPGHPHFAPELEAAVQMWLELFSEKPADVPVAQKPAMTNWLHENRPDAVKATDGQTSANAIARIVSVANPRKVGGRPRKSVLS